MTAARVADPAAERDRRPRPWWPWVRLLGGAALLALVIWRLGTGPFLDGIRSIDATALAVAAGIGVVTTVCSAWRWHLVAEGLGIALPMRTAVAAYYRSQFLNSTLPGGVLGDVHRAVLHGRDVDDVGRGIRAVAWERSVGPVVHLALTLAVLLVLPSPFQAWMPAVAAAAVLLAVLVLVRATRVSPDRPLDRSTRLGRLRSAVGDDLRAGLLARSAWPGVLAASVVVAAGHTATFVVAARTAGAAASPVQLLPLALLVLLAMVVPLNIGGWGPREGMAAWAFAAAGLGAAQGVAAATVYGVLALVATLPGAVVLVAGSVHRRVARAAGRPTTGVARKEAAARG